MQDVKILDLEAARAHYKRHKELHPGKDAMVTIQDGEAALVVFGVPEMDAEESFLAVGIAPAIPGVCERGALTLAVEAKPKPKSGKAKELLFALPLEAWRGEFMRLLEARRGAKVLLVSKTPQVVPQSSGGVLPVVAVQWPAAEFAGEDLRAMVGAVLLADELVRRAKGQSA